VKIYVKDANLILDLFNGRVLDAWFALGYETITTSLVLREVSDEGQKMQLNTYVSKGLLKIEDVVATDWVKISELSVKWSVSIPDASVAMLALKTSSCLLTGDGRLRKKAEEIGIDVRGILWVLDHLIEEQKITSAAACKALKSIAGKGAFLPHGEVEIRRQNFRGQLVKVPLSFSL